MPPAYLDVHEHPGHGPSNTRWGVGWGGGLCRLRSCRCIWCHRDLPHCRCSSMMHMHNGFIQAISGNKHGKIMFGCFDETTLQLPSLVPLLRVHQRIVRDEFMKGARSEQYAPSLQVVSKLTAKGVKPSVLLKRCVARSMVLCGPWPLSSKWNVGTEHLHFQSRQAIVHKHSRTYKLWGPSFGS